MPNININIELFGFLQDCSKNKTISLVVPSGSTISEIKIELLNKFNDSKNEQKLKDLPENCVLANETEIFQDHIHITSNANLVILPPVCGG